MVAGSGGTAEYHCDVGEQMSFEEDLDWMGFGSVTSVSFSVSLRPFFGDFTALPEDFFSLGFGFSVGRSVASSFAFPSRFFFEEPACRSFKNVETSVVRVGYFNGPGGEKRS